MEVTKLYNPSNIISPVVAAALATKQATLVSGTNIKTLTSQSMLGSGNYDVLMKFTNGWSLQVPDNTATGGNARGAGAVDLQALRITAGQVASGANSFNTGVSNTASGAISSCFGNKGIASGAASSTFGLLANTNSIAGKVAMGCGSTADTAGAAQIGFIPLSTRTTNATPSILISVVGAASATNQSVLLNNSAHAIFCMVVSRDIATGNMATWRIEAAIKRGANASTTAIVGTPTVTMLFNNAAASTWTVAATADTTNGALALTATGEAGKTIDWIANLITTEVI